MGGVQRILNWHSVREVQGRGRGRRGKGGSAVTFSGWVVQAWAGGSILVTVGVR